MITDNNPISIENGTVEIDNTYTPSCEESSYNLESEVLEQNLVASRTPYDVTFIKDYCKLAESLGQQVNSDNFTQLVTIAGKENQETLGNSFTLGLLERENIEKKAIAVKACLRGLFVNFNGLVAIIKTIDPNERKLLREVYKSRYGSEFISDLKKVYDKKLSKNLDKYFKKADKELAEIDALLENHDSYANELNFDRLISIKGTKDKDGLVQFFKEINVFERNRLIEKFKALNVDEKACYKKFLKALKILDKAETEAKEEIKKDLNLVANFIENLDKLKVYKAAIIILNKTNDEKERFLKDFTDKYGDFKDYVNKYYKKNQLQADLILSALFPEDNKYKDLVKRNGIPVIYLLADSFHGIGTYEKGVITILKSLSKAEIEKVKEEYHQNLKYKIWDSPIHLVQISVRKLLGDNRASKDKENNFIKKGRNLTQDIFFELDGTDAFLAESLLNGNNRPYEEKLLDLIRLTKAKKSPKLSSLVDKVSVEGILLKRSLSKLNDLYTKKDLNQTINQALFNYYENITLETLDNYSKTAKATTFNLGNLAAAVTIGTTASICLSNNLKILSAWYTVGSIATVITTSARFGIGRLIHGKSHSTERFFLDFCFSAFEGFSLQIGAIGGKLKTYGRRAIPKSWINYFNKKIVQKALSFGVKNSVKAFFRKHFLSKFSLLETNSSEFTEWAFNLGLERKIEEGRSIADKASREGSFYLQ